MSPPRLSGVSSAWKDLAADVGSDVMDVTGRGDGLERRLDAQLTDWPVERVDEISLKDVLFDDLLPLQHDAGRRIRCGEDVMLLDDPEDVLDARVQLVVAHPLVAVRVDASKLEEVDRELRADGRASAWTSIASLRDTIVSWRGCDGRTAANRKAGAREHMDDQAASGQLLSTGAGAPRPGAQLTLMPRPPIRTGSFHERGSGRSASEKKLADIL